MCLDACRRLYESNLELAYAAMHTTGQSLGMAYAGSGTNALDRGIEAVAQAHLAHERVAPSAAWERDFGSTTVRLDKSYRPVPLGPAVVDRVRELPGVERLPRRARQPRDGQPGDPQAAPQLGAADGSRGADPARGRRGRRSRPGRGLAVRGLRRRPRRPAPRGPRRHPHRRLHRIGRRSGPGSRTTRGRRGVYTETSGANFVVLHSLDRPGAGAACARRLAVPVHRADVHGPQNVYLPRGGLPTSEGVLTPPRSRPGSARRSGDLDLPAQGGRRLGAVQAQSTLDRLERVRGRWRSAAGAARAEALRAPRPPAARTSGPLVGRGRRRPRPLRRRAVRPGRLRHRCRRRRRRPRTSDDRREGVGAITAFVFSTTRTSSTGPRTSAPRRG